jgi:hypothetical protein
VAYLLEPVSSRVIWSVLQSVTERQVGPTGLADDKAKKCGEDSVVSHAQFYQDVAEAGFRPAR